MDRPGLIVATNDPSIAEVFRAVAQQRDLTLRRIEAIEQLADVEVAENHLLFIDADWMGRAPGNVRERLERHKRHIILICSPRSAELLNQELMNAAHDLMAKPVTDALLNHKISLYMTQLRQDETLRTTNNRIMELSHRGDALIRQVQNLQQHANLLREQRVTLDTVLSKMQMITRLSRQINCLDFQQIVDVCISRIPLLIDARFASLYMYDYSRTELRLQRHNHPYPIARIVKMEEALDSPMALAIERKKLILIRDFDEMSIEHGREIRRAFSENYASGSCIIAPLMSGNRVIGVLNLADKTTGRCFDEATDLPPVEQLCELLGASIRNVELFQEVQRQARSDGMTNLANHKTFYQELSKEVARARRYESPLAMIMVDIDSLKQINDMHGHQAGDLALKHVAHCISENVRDIDLAARYGGDEFSVILPSTDLESAKTVAGRILNGIYQKPVTFAGKPLTVTVSLGVGRFTGSENAEEFLKQIDEALYEAKRSGKNRIVIAGVPAS